MPKRQDAGRLSSKTMQNKRCSTTQSYIKNNENPLVKQRFQCCERLEKPLYSKVPDLKHFARLVINRFNLRNYTESRDIEYIRAYPYPI